MEIASIDFICICCLTNFENNQTNINALNGSWVNNCPLRKIKEKQRERGKKRVYQNGRERERKKESDSCFDKNN